MSHWDNLRKRSEDRLQKSIDEHSREQNAMCECEHGYRYHLENEGGCWYELGLHPNGAVMICACEQFTAQNKKEGEEK